jgi:hypothetical protein
MSDDEVIDEDDTSPEGLLHVLHADRLYTFVKETHRNPASFDYFGGPLEAKISGIHVGPMPLHHIATFMAGHVGAAPQLGAIPLVYGMCFDGCQMAYEFSRQELKVTRIKPQSSSEAWPYPNYPPLLPYYQLKLAGSEECSWKRFAHLFINQPDEQPADVVAVVPPPFDIGMSFWGPGDDLNDVQLVFNCHLQKRTIEATNHCT